MTQVFDVRTWQHIYQTFRYRNDPEFRKRAIENAKRWAKENRLKHNENQRLQYARRTPERIAFRKAYLKKRYEGLK